MKTISFREISMIPCKRSLLAKVNFVHYLFLLASLVIAFLSIYTFFYIYQREELFDRAFKDVEALSVLKGDLKRLEMYLLNGDGVGLKRSLREVEEKASYQFFSLPSLNATLTLLRRRIDRPSDIEHRELALRLSSLIAEVDYRIGKELTGLDRGLEEERRKLYGIFLLYIFLSLSGSVFIILGHYINIERVLKPVKELTRAAESFTEGRRDVRVQVTSEDELGELARTFNEMAETIREKERALMELNRELEEKVRKRTEELERACRDLRETQDRLLQTERLAIAGEVSSKVAHSILAPLSALTVNLETLQRCFEKERCPGVMEDCNRTFKVMEEELKRICGMLRRYARFSKNPQPPKRERASLEEVIDEAVLLFFNKARQAGVRIEKRYGETPEVLIDRGQMREALLNLADNAIEAMEEGGVLTFETSVAVKRVLLKVSDTGCGMDRETLDSLFVPFRSTKPRGLGLGLNIVKQIVESHGGAVSCESYPGKGTTFIVSLPLAEEV